jgi:hypothetical protein
MLKNIIRVVLVLYLTFSIIASLAIGGIPFDFDTIERYNSFLQISLLIGAIVQAIVMTVSGVALVALVMQFFMWLISEKQ